jgi:xylulokinase
LTKKRSGLYHCRESGGSWVTELRLAGGGTLKMAWQQLLADVLRVPLSVTTVAAASARGAALLAGMGIGVYADAQATLNLTPNPTLAPQLPDPMSQHCWRLGGGTKLFIRNSR